MQVDTSFQFSSGLGVLSSGFNVVVTDWSNALSRHLGARYIVGKGGREIADVIKALRE